MTSAAFDVLGIGNAIVDVISRSEEAFLGRNGLVKGSMMLIDEARAESLYARVDGVVRDGVLIVIEVEVLEPALFMEFDPSSAERFAEATMRRLTQRAKDPSLRSG